MLLPQLVNLFNDKFAQEQQNASYRPLFIEDGKVKAVFKALLLESELMPLLTSDHPYQKAGYIAQILLTPKSQLNTFSQEVTADFSQKKFSDFSMVNFDRLCRTLHVLNALTLIKNRNDFLVLEVSSRHIIDIQYGHGRYFAKILEECRLQPKNIVISMTIHDTYAADMKKVLAGLNNYRQLGYKIALNLGSLFSKDSVLDLILDIAPDYVTANPFCRSYGTVDLYAANYAYTSVDLNHGLLSNLHHLKQILCLFGGNLIVQRITKESEAIIARQVGADLVTGHYYQSTVNLNAWKKFQLKRPATPYELLV